uniref:Uncharacterized protein n=1 Tax=Anguilla anguilla TaxID=7936 RepID=A0A0E9PZ21_ANGAN
MKERKGKKPNPIVSVRFTKLGRLAYVIENCHSV